MAKQNEKQHPQKYRNNIVKTFDTQDFHKIFRTFKNVKVWSVIKMVLKIKNISIVVRILINCNSNVNKTVKIGKNLSEAIQNQQNFLKKL